jgi:hypothetical protein
MSSRKVVPFPMRKGRLPVNQEDALEVTLPRREAFLRGLGFVWMMLRLPLFLVMYWLRGLVILLCGAVSVPALLLWLFSLYAFPEKTYMTWGFGVISFGSFVLMWAYDYILTALSPQDMMRSR